MAQFYIHIGMPKAGSSSIQRNFFKLRPFLLDRSINYLDLHANHSRTLVSLLLDVPHRYHFNFYRGINTPKKAAAFNHKIRKRLMHELEKNASKKIVISAEALCEVPFAGVQQLKKIVDPFATSFRVICYVRHPYDYMSSATQQNVKAGIVGRTAPLPGYKERIENFVQVFGRENVDVRILESTELVHANLISDFLAAIEESPDLLDGQEIVKANESLCHEAVLIYDALNNKYPPLESGEKNPDRANLEKWLSQIKGPKFVLGTEFNESVHAQIRSDLDWLHTFLGRNVFELDPRGESQPRWDAETIESLASLLNTMARSIRQQEVALRLSDNLLARLNKLDPALDLPLTWQDSGFAPAHYVYNLSRAFVALNQPELALRAAKEADKLQPGNSEYLNWLNGLKNKR